MAALTLLTPPAFPFIKLEAMKAHLRTPFDDEDDVIPDYVEAAAGFIEGPEGVTRRMFRRSRWLLETDFARCVEIPLPPLASVESVNLIADDEDPEPIEQGAGGFRIRRRGDHAYLEFGPARRGSLAVTFWAGFEEAAWIPKPVLQAVRLLTAHYFETREAAQDRPPEAIALGVKDLLERWIIPHKRTP